MNFTIIEPGETRIRMIDAREPFELYTQIGLSPGNVDHGVVVPGIGIVVDGFSLFVPPEHQRYFTIGRRLYGGNAILYGFDGAGETIDILAALERNMMPPVIFISVAGIKRAIAADQIDQPIVAVNGLKTWEWPAPSLPEQP